MLKANIKTSSNYKGEDLDKLNRALSLLETTINGDKFKIAVLNFSKFQFVRFNCIFRLRTGTTQLQEFTNQEVYDILTKGHRQEGSDSFMDLQLVLSEAGSRSAVGQTTGNVTTTYRSAFKRMIDGEFAAHLTHEWTHTLGFEHSFSNKCDRTRDCLTVPYAIGNIIEIITTGKCWYNCKYKTLYQ